MTVIKAWQHIYAHVEKEQSPQRQRGFQTLFYSQDGINRADLQILERRVFFDVNSGLPYKRQYYPLSKGRVVLAQAVPLPEPDRMGRGGRYLFHNLIFEELDWERINCQPFNVFAKQPFDTRLETFLEQGNMTNGNINPISLDVKENNEAERIEFLASNWKSDALVDLSWLAFNVTKLQEKQKHLAIVGSQEMILDTIELAFLLATSESRKQCFFDTGFYRSDFSRTPVWMAGFMTFPGSEYIEISPVFSLGPSLISSKPQTPFERWRVERIRNRELKEYVRLRDLTVAMDSVLREMADDSSKKRIKVADTRELVSFSRDNANSLEKLAIKSSSKNIPEELAAIIISNYRNNPEELWGVILDGISIKSAAKYLEPIYRYHSPPSRRELDALVQLATESQYKPLISKTAFWRRSKNPAAWEKTLAEMSINEYSKVGKELLQSPSTEIFDWLDIEKIDTWLSLCLPSMLSSQIIDIANYLISIHREDILDQLAPKIEAMNYHDQLALKKLVESKAELAPDLWKLLTAREDPSRLRTIFKHKHEKPSGH